MEESIPPTCRNRARSSLTNDPTKLNELTCSICHIAIKSHLFTKHLEKKHEISNPEYQDMGGEYSYVHLRYHKCQICECIVMFDADTLQMHTKLKHGMTRQEYTKNFLKKYRHQSATIEVEQIKKKSTLSK